MTDSIYRYINAVTDKRVAAALTQIVEMILRSVPESKRAELVGGPPQLSAKDRQERREAERQQAAAPQVQRDAEQRAATEKERLDAEVRNKAIEEQNRRNNEPSPQAAAAAAKAKADAEARAAAAGQPHKAGT